MKHRLLEILACPRCRGELTSSVDAPEIIEGELSCENCKKIYPVVNGIPRFVEADGYANSFGYQWNLFRKEQIDSYNGTTLSADRLWNETGWDPERLKGKWVLDAGCGAGRFLDVAAGTEGQIVGIDISSAIDAAQANLEGRDNVHFVQASIYELPFREGTFDFCYCIGVIQHTPEPEKSLQALGRMVKLNGEITVTIYPRKPWTRLFSKYWFRPITKRMKKETLLNGIRAMMPVAFPITDVLFRLPGLGKIFMFAIPIANYVNEKQLNREQRYSWAILDTFDMLSPYYDQPMTRAEASNALKEVGVDPAASRHGLTLVGKRM
jgi:uncharacterized protein YbaR (Trm112 family)